MVQFVRMRPATLDVDTTGLPLLAHGLVSLKKLLAALPPGDVLPEAILEHGDPLFHNNAILIKAMWRDAMSRMAFI